MFRFEDPQYFWLLAVVALLFVVRFVSDRLRMRRLRRFGDAELVKSLMPDVSARRSYVKFGLLAGALALVVVMLARPQMGAKVSTENRNGIEAIICIDISNSMLARDVVPSRLDKTKMLVENMVDNFTNDKIGLVVFAGDAFVQLPIAHAINLAANSFTQQKNVGRAIILVTDGEDHEGGASEAAAAAKKKGINVFILGVGSKSGAPIPLGAGEYMKDNAGNTVMSALNETMCQQLARAGSGTYIHVDNTNDAQKRLDDELAKLQKGETESVVYSEYDEQFQAVGLLVLLVLLAEICVLEARNPRLRNINIFKRKK